MAVQASALVGGQNKQGSHNLRVSIGLSRIPARNSCRHLSSQASRGRFAIPLGEQAWQVRLPKSGWGYLNLLSDRVPAGSRPRFWGHPRTESKKITGDKASCAGRFDFSPRACVRSPWGQNRQWPWVLRSVFVNASKWRA